MDKYPGIFLRQMETIVYIFLLFFNQSKNVAKKKGKVFLSLIAIHTPVLKPCDYNSLQVFRQLPFCVWSLRLLLVYVICSKKLIIYCLKKIGGFLGYSPSIYITASIFAS